MFKTGMLLFHTLFTLKHIWKQTGIPSKVISYKYLMAGFHIQTKGGGGKNEHYNKVDNSKQT